MAHCPLDSDAATKQPESPTPNEGNGSEQAIYSDLLIGEYDCDNAPAAIVGNSAQGTLFARLKSQADKETRPA